MLFILLSKLFLCPHDHCKTIYLSQSYCCIMEHEEVIRATYWLSFFVLVAILALVMISDRLSILFRIVLVLLLAFLSSMFRFEDRFSFVSIVVVLVAGFAAGTVLSDSPVQFWSLSFLYVIIFFLGCEVFERNLLGI